jgi:hypothetical protein
VPEEQAPPVSRRQARRALAMSASQQQELPAQPELQPARRASAQAPRQLVLVPQELPALLVSERQARAAPR